MIQLRILVCAFACDPKADSGLGSSEDLLGWNIVKQIGRFHETWVVTSPLNKSGIEATLQQDRLYNTYFYYVNLPSCLQWPLQRLWSLGGSQFYSYLWQVRAYFAARNLHRQFHFDVFHHVTYANDWMASFIGVLLRIPYIRGPGGGAHKTPKGFLREYSLCGRLWERLRALGKWLFLHDPFFIMGQRRARAILVCNREALAKISQKWHHKVQLFPVNGISLRDLSSAEASERDDEKFCILSAGRLLRIKGFGLAIKAFKAFVVRYPEAKLTIVGDGPELSRLEGLVRKLGLETQVRFEKWMAREKLLVEMTKCDVFLFPSMRDGGGAVVVEAMASGIPVICLDLAGPGFHIKDEWGIKIEPKNPDYVVEEMAKALELLYLDEDLRREVGRRARERAEEYYLWDRLGDRLQRIYEEVL